MANTGGPSHITADTRVQSYTHNTVNTRGHGHITANTGVDIHITITIPHPVYIIANAIGHVPTLWSHLPSHSVTPHAPLLLVIRTAQVILAVMRGQLPYGPTSRDVAFNFINLPQISIKMTAWAQYVMWQHRAHILRVNIDFYPQLISTWAMSQGLSLSRAFHRSTAMWPACCRASSQTACGQTGSLSPWTWSAPSFWKHFAHICLTIISRSMMIFVWGADFEHVPNWNSRHHHVPRFAVLPASPLRRGPLGLFSFPLVPFFILSRDPQSAFLGFSSTIFSTWSKLSGSLAHVGRRNVPGVPGACATRNFMHLATGPWHYDGL